MKLTKIKKKSVTFAKEEVPSVLFTFNISKPESTLFLAYYRCGIFLQVANHRKKEKCNKAATYGSQKSKYQIVKMLRHPEFEGLKVKII